MCFYPLLRLFFFLFLRLFGEKSGRVEKFHTHGPVFDTKTKFRVENHLKCSSIYNTVSRIIENCSEQLAGNMIDDAPEIYLRQPGAVE